MKAEKKRAESNVVVALQVGKRNKPGIFLPYITVDPIPSEFGVSVIAKMARIPLLSDQMSY